MSQIANLKRLARENELQVLEYGDGPQMRVLVIGGLVNVHWWPLSKRQTCYAEGAPKGHHRATAAQVINLATKGVLR